MTESIRVFAPATVANLGPGFDIIGMAIEEPGDIVVASHYPQPGVFIRQIVGDGGELTTDALKNTAGIAAEFVRGRIAPNAGVELRIEKGLPLASGLGSSAASAVAAAVAVNALFGNPLSKYQLLPALLAAEASVSGQHLDNAAPSLFGGIVLANGTDAQDVHILPVGPRLGQRTCFVLATPHMKLPTSEARQALPDSISFAEMVEQTKGIATLIHAIHTDDVVLFARALMMDKIIFAARSCLIPHSQSVIDLAMEQGALAGVISGGGPTLLMLAPDTAIAERVTTAVSAFFGQTTMGVTMRTVRIAEKGAVTL